MLTHIINELQKKGYTMEEAVDFILTTIYGEINSDLYHTLLEVIIKKLGKSTDDEEGILE